MSNFTVQKQDDLIRALMAHPDNFQSSPQFALGYMVSMLTRAIGKLPEEQQALAIADIDYLIDRHKKAEQGAKAGR